jgi:hypothetical protein
MKLNLPPKLLEKLVWVAVIFHVVKFQFPVRHLMPSSVETGSSWPLIAGLYR